MYSIPVCRRAVTIALQMSARAIIPGWQVFLPACDGKVTNKKPRQLTPNEKVDKSAGANVGTLWKVRLEANISFSFSCVNLLVSDIVVTLSEYVKSKV